MAANYMQPLNFLKKELLGQWLRKADGDLRAAERLADAPEDYDAVTFHCQQAAEKYLKARLAVTGAEPPRTHDWRRSLLTLQDVELFTTEKIGMADLPSPFGIAIRYPSEDNIESPSSNYQLLPAISATNCGIL